MAVSQRLELRQTQTLVMTPQLQQAIKLLQLSNLEVAAYVEQEIERNPLLERDDGDDAESARDTGSEATDYGAGAETESAAPDDAAAEAVPDTLELTAADTIPGEMDAPLDADFENIYDTSPTDDWAANREAAPAQATTGPWPEDDGRSTEQTLAQSVTLRQHLIDQLQMDVRDPVDRMIGLHLIEMLDECGYIAGDLTALATLLGCAPERIETTLRIVQRFDPPGVFARSLRECLALQLADRDRLDPAMQTMLDHLPLVAQGDLPALRELCGVDDDDLAEMIAEIKALNPKPAQAFEQEIAETLVPDVLMRPDPKGGWIVELNTDTLPRVLINGRYYAQISGQARTQEDKEYISQQLQSANWLVRALHQRATTILRVATEIVRLQDTFFRRGVQHLKPLTLRDIAQVISMHESTVSRVTSNKYMATPRGNYELKYFFTTAVGGSNGAPHSSEAIRHRIKAMIEEEPLAGVLSDDAIVDLLRRDGVEIARRTVAKYREAMGISSSVQRRRDKAAKA